MTRLGVVVEGHGEVLAVPVLLRRILHECLGIFDVQVTRPVRMSRSRLAAKFPDLERQVALAATEADAVLVLFDADDDCPADLAPKLLARAKKSARGVPVAVVLANREYEAWFLASVDALRGANRVSDDAVAPVNPEGVRGAKQAFERVLDPGEYYSETVDQPRFSHAIDLAMVREAAPSFDKLWRDLELLVAPGIEGESS